MKLTAALAVEKMAGKRIHFSGFDSDQPDELVCWFCCVEGEMVCLIYQYCDAWGIPLQGVWQSVGSHMTQMGEEADQGLLRAPVAGSVWETPQL